jgi:hypothetical protein
MLIRVSPGSLFKRGWVKVARAGSKVTARTVALDMDVFTIKTGKTPRIRHVGHLTGSRQL